MIPLSYNIGQSSPIPFSPLGGGEERSVVSQSEEAVVHPPALELSLSEQIAKEAQKCKILSFGSGCKPLLSFLNNDFPSSLEMGGLRFSCATSAYEAQKFSGNPELMRCFTTLNAEEAYIFSAKNYQLKDKDWLKNRTGAMEGVLQAKFLQNPQLLQKLLMTADACLVFHAPHKKMDPFWSDDTDGSGQNAMGRILMELRQKEGGYGPSSPLPSQIVSAEPPPVYPFSALNASDAEILAEIDEMNRQMDEKSYEQNTQIARRPENLEFTRFQSTNFPYDDTLVRLSSDRYINASFVLGKKKFIATQSPMPHTCQDFWTMVLDQGVRSVIMLNRLGDPGEQIYFPLHLGDRKQYGDITLELSETPLFKTDPTWRQLPNEEEPHAIIHRTIKVWKERHLPHIVHHFQYQNWIDLAAGNERAVAYLVQTVNRFRAENEGYATAIHCHAGVGRTGVVMALLKQLDLLQQGKEIALKQLIERMRSPLEGRCHSVVLVPDQYHFCHRVLRVMFPPKQ